MTQLERARELVSDVWETMGGSENLMLSKWVNDLQWVIIEAQNQPPGGASDGTIDKALWYNLGDLREALREFDRCLDQAYSAVWRKES